MSSTAVEVNLLNDLPVKHDNMKAEIIPFKTGVTSCYLIRGKEIVMVDSGMPNKPKNSREMLSEHNIDPEQIKLIVLTHSHFDHSGSAMRIREMTGARIAIHESEKTTSRVTKY